MGGFCYSPTPRMTSLMPSSHQRHLSILEYMSSSFSGGTASVLLLQPFSGQCLMGRSKNRDCRIAQSSRARHSNPPSWRDAHIKFDNTANQWISASHSGRDVHVRLLHRQFAVHPRMRLGYVDIGSWLIEGNYCRFPRQNRSGGPRAVLRRRVLA
jgi:hypothetical protein